MNRPPARPRPPDHLPQHVLDRPDFVAACANQDLGAVLKIARQYGGPGFTASHLARRCELTNSRVSEYMSGKRIAATAQVIARIADALHIPGQMLGLAPRDWETNQPPRRTQPPDHSDKDEAQASGPADGKAANNKAADNRRAKEWGERLRRWREDEKLWSRNEFCEHYTACAVRIGADRSTGPDDELSARHVQRWETGLIKTLHFRSRRILREMGAPEPDSERQPTPTESAAIAPATVGATAQGGEDTDAGVADLVPMSGSTSEASLTARDTNFSSTGEDRDPSHDNAVAVFDCLYAAIFTEDSIGNGVDPGKDLAEVDDMDRRQLLRIFGMTGALLATPRSADAASVPNDSLYADTSQILWKVFSGASSKINVLPLVREKIDAIRLDLERPHGEQAHQMLCESMASLFQLSGEIFFDADRYTDATHCYTLAAQAGKEVGAFDLWACALTRSAFVAIYEKEFAQASSMLEAAARIARRGDPGLSTRYWVAAVQAEAFAGLGDLDRCRRALDSAEQVQSLSGVVHNGGWLRFDSSRIAEERGACYVSLGRSDLAESSLIDALSGALTSRRRASIFTDLATIGAQRRDVDIVISYIDKVLDEARETGSGVIQNKLRSFQPRLGAMLDNRRIRELNEKIDVLA